MNPKVVYNPEEPSGQLYYIDGDTMLTFEYEYYKRNRGGTLLINLPLHYDDDRNPESEQQLILNFIGFEVATRQPRPSYYKIDSGYISINRLTAFHWIRAWHKELALGILLIIPGLYMMQKGMIIDASPSNTPLHRKSPFPLRGEFLLGIAIIVFIDTWFKRKKDLKKQLLQQKFLSRINTWDSPDHETNKHNEPTNL